ncbi:hypothetical protein Vadar_030392 [Vaccinium darrowii]|uniref:Uncharacterized protein n=1 Tax=Vaccinium darrowii TaxID=229202 RepID=A0ACB7XU85_9ERIC|nr:hypothetical protein Vadar_030392 [Vaccinium darrowii]
MKELKVVALARMSIPSLPMSLRCLTNLQTLSLSDCKLFGADLSVIGALKNLEILSFAGSHIREFPREICNLTRLKLLDLWYCNEIESVRIPHGVLSSLSKLEELYLGLNFMEWDVVEEGKDMILTNACVAELASLPNLVALDIYVPIIESRVWPRDHVFVLGNIRAFHICFAKSICDYLGVPKSPPTNRLELLDIDISRGVKEIVGLEMLLKITRFLFLDSVTAPGVKYSISDLDEDGFKHLSELQVEDCSDLECLINTSNGHLAKEAFGALKTLYLSDLPHPMHLRKGPTQLACLRNLMSVSVSQCPKLKHCVFPLAIVRNLVQLKSIMIKFCDTLDVIVSDIGGGGEHEIAAAAEKRIILKTNNETAIGSVFNKDTLRSIGSLSVSSMDNLVEIWPVDLEAKLRAIMVSHCHKLSNILFPSNLMECIQNLGSVKVNYCNSVEVVFDLCGLNVGGKGKGPIAIALPCLVDLDLSNLQDLKPVWANDTPAIQGFQNLRSITINGCGSLRILLSPFVAKLLVNLQEFRILSCKVMEAIIDWEQEADDGMTTSMTIIFPKLTSLSSRNCHSLQVSVPRLALFKDHIWKECLSVIVQQWSHSLQQSNA